MVFVKTANLPYELLLRWTVADNTVLLRILRGSAKFASLVHFFLLDLARTCFFLLDLAKLANPVLQPRHSRVGSGLYAISLAPA